MKDRFGREITYLRMSVTELCNLRCRYCMPAEGICKRSHDEMLSQEETLLALRVAAELGVRKLRVTGGEPLVKPNILDICAGAAQIPGIEEICLTTNGILLPGLAKPLKRAGVSRLNISLDTLDERKYAWMTRVGALDMALKGIEAALDAGFEHTKLGGALPALAGGRKVHRVDADDRQGGVRPGSLYSMQSGAPGASGARVGGEKRRRGAHVSPAG